ncbi:ABC transporter permease [Ilumatobacter nonamiensis]|uniref:ABC transporter permease n=1 Tax=Ilumatobacter nonamiensis TaxID=467093 RepID=UPI00034B327A|nr:ABC transporter permease [Ilumatobacter nonamiensis]
MSDRRLAARRLRPVVQFAGLFRKEVLVVLRQPRLLLILVVGPFLVLGLFAVGFDAENTVLDTAFVGPQDSMYESSLEEFADEMEQYVNYAGYSGNVVDAEHRLAEGDIDLVVVLPADPVNDVLSGEQATIKVLHNKIDPIQVTTVEVSAQVAVQELNAQILERVVAEAQGVLVPFDEGIDRAGAAVGELSTALESGDEGQIRSLVTELEESSASVVNIVDVSEQLATELDGSTGGEFDDLVGSATDLEQLVADLAADSDMTAEDLDALEAAVAEVAEKGDLVTTLDPTVIVRPFAGETTNLQRESISVSDFFAPGAVALLVQHMVLTFAALSLVTDRAAGLFELYRVGPIGSGRIVLGKVAAFAFIGAGAAAALFATLTLGLDVPMRGDVGWLIGGTALLLVASIGLGLCISLASRTDTQAVQYALLALLAGLFFGGFFLDLDAFSYPVKALSWTMPVTYGTRIYRDILLRGVSPEPVDVVGLTATMLVYLSISWYFLRRRIRVE